MSTLLFAGLVAMTSPTHANVDTLSKQRGLVDQLSFAACMVMANLNPKTNSALALKAVDEFESLAASASGSKIATGPEGWSQFKPAVQQIAHSDFHTVIVTQFLSQRSPLAQNLDRAVHDAIAQTTGDGPRVAQHVQRLSTISQQIGTDICLIAMEVDAARAMEMLKSGTSRFDALLLALEEGDPNAGIPPPQDVAFEDALWMLRGDWDALLETLDETGAYQGVSRDALVTLSEMLGVLYIACEEILALYETSQK